MLTWYLDAEVSSDVKNTFASINQIFSLTPEEILSQDSISYIFKTRIDGRVFYIKRYTASGRKLRQYFGRSYCRGEWKNVLFLKSLGISGPKLVAYGEERSIFNRKKYRGIVVTEEIPSAVPLSDIPNIYPEIFKNNQWRLKVIGKVAGYVRSLHKRKFIHYDLNWRNIMVTKNIEDPKVYFIDIPSGRLRKNIMYWHGIKKDLANLDKLGEYFLSKTDRLRFYLLYKQKPRLTASDRLFVYNFLTYKQKKKKNKGP